MLILVDGEVEEENKDTRYGEGAPGFPPHLLVDNAVEEPAVEEPANFPPRSSVVLIYMTPLKGDCSGHDPRGHSNC